MKLQFVQKYFSIVFLLASFMGSFHYHNDLAQHTDCQICVISSTIADSDTPTDVVYLSEIELLHEATLSQLPYFASKHIGSHNNPRAPPSFILNS